MTNGPGPRVGRRVGARVVETGDFEAVLHWAIGTDVRADFRVSTLNSPPRLVIDVSSR
jgi:hypothetical protein